MGVLGTAVRTLVHIMSDRMTQVLSGVYLYFKQPNDDKEVYWLLGTSVRKKLTT